MILRLAAAFGKRTRPMPKANKIHETRFGFAQTDEKAAKLSKSELDTQIKKKEQEEKDFLDRQKRQVEKYKLHHPDLELKVSEQTKYDLNMAKSIKFGLRIPTLTIPTPVELPNNIPPADCPPPPPGNYQPLVNKSHSITPITPSPFSKRCGAIGYKLGMTGLWDRWGKLHAVTVVRLDRCQIVQIKRKETEGYDAVQMGAGEKRLDKMCKAEIGHFMGANIPPKQNLFEFRVNPENFLPVGYMLTARHFTPGQLVDCISRTCGKGFAGTIKKFGFKRQPASHGNSRSHRVLGSTGMRQDPGRVFKGKKMYGRMGNQQRITYNIKIYKIDVEKSLIYLKGCIGGKPGTVVRIRDASKPFAWTYNQQYVSYPTFVEQPGKTYATQMEMFVGLKEKIVELHDNAYIVETGEVEDLTATLAKDEDDD